MGFPLFHLVSLAEESYFWGSVSQSREQAVVLGELTTLWEDLGKGLSCGTFGWLGKRKKLRAEGSKKNLLLRSDVAKVWKGKGGMTRSLKDLKRGRGENTKRSNHAGTKALQGWTCRPNRQ